MCKFVIPKDAPLVGKAPKSGKKKSESDTDDSDTDKDGSGDEVCDVMPSCSAHYFLRMLCVFCVFVR